MEVAEVSDSTPLYVEIPRDLVLRDSAVADLVDGSMAQPVENGWRIFYSAKARRVLKGKL